MKCIICNKEIKSGCALSKHVHIKHNLLAKEYYDKYIKQPNEGFCLTCGKPTPFLKFSKGYQKHCNASCAQKDPNVNNIFKANNPQKNQECKEKSKQTCLERYGCEYSLQSKKVRDKGKVTLLDKYGVQNIYQLPSIQTKARRNSHKQEANQKREKTKIENIRKIAKENDLIYIQDLIKQTKSSGWYQCGVVPFVKINGYLFVKNSDIQKVIDYDNNTYKVYSLLEKKIVNSIKSVYSGEVIENSRKIIAPQEIDIYLPQLKLAIEFNGLYYHSQLRNKTKEYHLNKSIVCRKKGIRLIHIYEFEDIDKQILLLLSLINGNDNYPKDDFNKNNLLSQIPKPVKIFDNGRLVIYGAGALK